MPYTSPQFSAQELQTGKFVFCARKKFFTVRSARLEKLTTPSPPHTNWDILKYIFQILRASLAAARMAVFLRAEDLQRALHTFQSGKNSLAIRNNTFRSNSCFEKTFSEFFSHITD